MINRIAFAKIRRKTRFLGTTFSLVAALPMMIGQANPTASGGGSQDGAGALPSVSFEVISIHLDKPITDGRGSMQVGFTPNGTFTGRGLPLKKLICMAYNVDDLQVSGGPDWLKEDRYTIEAKTDAAGQEAIKNLSGPRERLVGQRMVQELLADRFKLKIHQETKEMPVLALLVAKAGPKVHESVPGDTYENGLKDRDGHGHQGMMRFNNGKLVVQGVPLDRVTAQLTEQLHQIVQNKTGLKGNYDFTLQWTPEVDHDRGPSVASGEGGGPAADASGPSIYTAIQEQLGLKLESQKGAVPVFVIDQVEKPSEN